MRAAPIAMLGLVFGPAPAMANNIASGRSLERGSYNLT